MATETTTRRLSTVERLLEEVDEWSGRVAKIRRRMSHLRHGSEPYLEILSDLWVDLTLLEQKAKHAAEAVEAFQESLPEKRADSTSPCRSAVRNAERAPPTRRNRGGD